MTRPPIRVMPLDLALKIAAGEVVERPASAVKELLDNAVDAGATAIRVEVREAGLKSIRVTDNGHGIRSDELPLAFSSHATSKIADLADLEELVTLGFRGEALPSIAAVSRVDVQTRTPDQSAGARYTVEYGQPVGGGVCSAPQGMRITVSDLFSNVPARRKFARSLRAESAQIASVVMRYALAQPDVALSLAVDGRTAFESPGSGRLRDAAAAVFGPDKVAALLEVDTERDGIAVRGLISDPSVSRQNRTAIHIVANGRPIANRSLIFALEEAYSGFLMIGRHPVAIIHLALPPAEIDANVHPSKSEVRFARDRSVHGAIHQSVAGTLMEARAATAPSLDVVSAAQDNVTVEQPSLDTPTPMSVPGSGDRPAGLSLPAMRVFGQTGATFIIAEGPQGLYMIDQHAAHERILFDQLDGQLDAGQVPSQPLLGPESVELTAEQIQALEEHADLLGQIGFVIEPFGNFSCLVRAVPSLARSGRPAEMVGEVLTELQTLPEPGAARERALAAMACRAAVKAGQTLDVEEMRAIVIGLERTARPATCPHGRPTMIHLSHSQMEREFGRR